MTIAVVDQFHPPILISLAETESDWTSHHRLLRGASFGAC